MLYVYKVAVDVRVWSNLNDCLKRQQNRLVCALFNVNEIREGSEREKLFVFVNVYTYSPNSAVQRLMQYSKSFSCGCFVGVTQSHLTLLAEGKFTANLVFSLNILCLKSSQSNHVSPEPPDSRALGSAG